MLAQTMRHHHLLLTRCKLTFTVMCRCVGIRLLPPVDCAINRMHRFFSTRPTKYSMEDRGCCHCCRKIFWKYFLDSVLCFEVCISSKAMLYCRQLLAKAVASAITIWGSQNSGEKAMHFVCSMAQLV